MKRLWFLAGALAGSSACGDNIDTCNPDAPNTICTVVGSTFDEGYAGDGGLATDAVLYIPMDTAIAPTGELWVIDFNNYVIRSVDDRGIIRTVVGNGLLGDSPAQDHLSQVAALAAANNHTTDMVFADGYLYLSAWHESRIKRVDLSTMMMENFAGRGRRTYYDGDGGPALMASLDLPSAIARAPNGDIAVMDEANQVIRSIDQNDVITTIVGTCIIDDVTQCAPADLVQCPGSEKRVCGGTTIAEEARVLPATACENVCTPGFAGDGGPALAARLSQPYGQAADPSGRMAYDRDGNLYFADTNNNRIRKVDTNGIITTIAGTGSIGYSGDGGLAIEAKLNRPVDLAVAADGSVLFTDVFNNCIRKIDPSGIISSVVGRCSSAIADRGFAGDGGPPLEAKLNRPYGIDLVGNKLYVSDSYNNRVRVVNLPE